MDATIIPRALEDIASYLASLPPDDDPGLLAGSSGRVLFFWTLSKRYPEYVPVNIINTLIDDILDREVLWRSRKDISDGLSGVASLFELLLQERIGPYDPSFNSGVDSVFLRLLEEGEWQGDLEYVKGLAGISVYAARRARKGLALQLYAEIIKVYEDKLVPFTEDQCAWATPPGSPYHSEYTHGSHTPEFNLGLAHGVPSIISALIPAVSIPSLERRSRDLVLRGCNWMIGQMQDAFLHGSYFSYYNHSAATSRLGWCYGDLSVANTLARAGKALKCKSIFEKAIQVGRSAALRTSRTSAQVRDSAICHGSSGLAVQFQVLYELTGNIEFLRAAKVWLEDLCSCYSERGL
ncbi:MAG TPA: hypothetical protein DDZ76_00340, partial [Xanthomonadales bacterium]|nr:hypothetical protein [Xanthomonadales bacterium]